MVSKLHLVHSPEHIGWAFDELHPTQGRRYINARQQLLSQAKDAGIEVIEKLPRVASKTELARIHSVDYINSVIDDHYANEWVGKRSDLAHLATLFAGGTLTALDLLLSGEAKTAIHFAGAKHHAQYDHSSGFCVFNDFAMAADIATKDHGKKIAILDIDGHHGDGTENLTKDNALVLTYSIHHFGIYPGTGDKDEAEFGIYNDGLSAGDGDDKLSLGVNRFIKLGKQFKAELIFIAAGADGHSEDPLTGLEYSVDGITEACRQIRKAFPDLPILMGGAGGYLPDTRTPEVWSAAALALHPYKTQPPRG
jgi:acetoin utilization protein AcuC